MRRLPDPSTYLKNPNSPEAKPLQYTFDASLWSHTPGEPGFISQAGAFEVVGKPLLVSDLSSLRSAVHAHLFSARRKTSPTTTTCACSRTASLAPARASPWSALSLDVLSWCPHCRLLAVAAGG